MKERPNFADIANEYVNHVEKEWLTTRFMDIQELEKRAKGSGTQQTKNEYQSAMESFVDELNRLGIDMYGGEDARTT